MFSQLKKKDYFLSIKINLIKWILSNWSDFGAPKAISHQYYFTLLSQTHWKSYYYFIIIVIILQRNFLRTIKHEVSGSYCTSPSDFEVMGTIFLIESWGFLTWNKFCGKNYKVRGIQEGSPIFFRRHLPFVFLNNSRLSNGRDVIRFLKEI